MKPTSTPIHRKGGERDLFGFRKKRRLHVVILYHGFCQADLEKRIDIIELIAKLHPEIDFDVEFRED